MHQIVFNKISAAELSAIPADHQLQLLGAFQVDEKALLEASDTKNFGIVEYKGKKLYRFRNADYRVYFSVEDDSTVVVQRVLNANTLRDFLFRAQIGSTEDQQLSNSRSFWKLIEEGEKSPRQS